MGEHGAQEPRGRQPSSPSSGLVNTSPGAGTHALVKVAQDREAERRNGQWSVGIRLVTMEQGGTGK